MGSPPFMQLYIADYLGDTRHLTTEQHGAYLLLMMTMWRQGGSLPNDASKLARIAGVSPRRWHLISDDVMAFFDIDGDQITQKRLVEEYQKCVSISEKRSVSGKAGGISKSLKNNNTGLANAKQMPKHTQISDIIKEDNPSLPTVDRSPSQKSTSEKSEKSRGATLPDDWSPKDRHFSLAEELGGDEAFVRKQAEAMRDWALGNQNRQVARKSDWDRTFNGWLRRELEKRGSWSARSPPSRRSDEKQSWISALAEEWQNEQRGDDSEASNLGAGRTDAGYAHSEAELPVGANGGLQPILDLDPIGSDTWGAPEPGASASRA